MRGIRYGSRRPGIRCFAVMRLSSVSAFGIAKREKKKRPSDALMMLPWARTNSTLSPDPPPPALGFRLPPAHKVICRQIISMTSDSNNTLLAVVLVWLNYPLRAQLVSGFQEGERKDKLATVSAGAQLVVLANDTGDQC